MDYVIERVPRRFDWIVRPQTTASPAPWDQALAETRNFVAIPSLGSIVPGWVVIVPRVAALNLAELSAPLRAELREIRDSVASVLSRQFDGDIFEFEHGPAHPGSLTGCGIDQAHLHVVPLSFNLLDAVCQTGNRTQIVDVADPWQQLDRGYDYWIVRDVACARSVIAYPTEPVSQGIRRVIASRTGQDDAWNYRTHPRFENVALTLSAFSRALA